MAHEHNMKITTGELAALLGAELIGPGSIVVSRVDSLEHAVPGTLSFVRSPRFASEWARSRASAALVSRTVPLTGMIESLGGNGTGEARALIVVPDADAAVVRLLEMLAPRTEPARPGIHPSAHVDPSATVALSAAVGPLCHVGRGASVGEGAVLVSSVHVGDGARVGARSILHPHVSVLAGCAVGDDCLLHPGVVIGADGFGFRPGADGRSLVKVPHIGNVVVHDQVEIGANTCVDRAKFGSTEIGSGTKIDNLVQIGHGCRIGRCCIICGQAGIAGSVVIGDGAVIGGKVGIADNLEVGAGAKIAAFAGVVSDVPAGETWMGAPAVPASEARRTFAAIKRLGRRSPRGE